MTSFKKNLSFLSLIALVALPCTPTQADDSLVEVPVNRVFFPGAGYDDNDNVQIMILKEISLIPAMFWANRKSCAIPLERSSYTSTRGVGIQTRATQAICWEKALIPKKFPWGA